MIQVHQLSKSYGEQVLFEDASFTIGASERIGLLGRNGSGKTTIAHIISGFYSKDSGDILYNNISIDNLNRQISLI